MSSTVVQQRLDEQGAKLGKPKDSDDKFSGGKTAKAQGLLILDRKARSASAWFLRDSLVGLELSFSVGKDNTIAAWFDSVRAALERKYGPPVHSDLMAGCSFCMGNSGEREAVWSISDSEIRLTIKASIESLLNKGDRLPGSVHLSYGIPPFRKGVVSITHGP